MGEKQKKSSRLTVRADAATRAHRAWAARAAGGTWAEVADLCGYASPGNACRAVSAYFGQLPQLDREELRALWRERHELMWRQSQRAVRDDKPGALRAAVAVARSASQLDGLDQPSRVELVTPDAEEFDRVVEVLLLAHRGGAGPEEADVFALPASSEG